MNDVSWRRILQNAGRDFPEDERMRQAPYGEIPEARDPRDARSGQQVPHTRQLQELDDALSGLERELQHALNRAAHNTQARQAPPAPMRRPRPAVAPEQPERRGAKPVPDLGERRHLAPAYAPEQAERRRHQPAYAPEQGERRRAQLPVPYGRPQQVPIPPRPAKRRGGLRNLIAISVSAAIVGFAAHEVSMQWNKSRANVAHHARLASADPAFTSSVPGKEPAMAQTYSIQTVQPAENDRGRNVALELGAADSGLSASGKLTAGEEEMLMQKAMAHLERGDVGLARRFLLQLANRRSALAAILLAKTYDTKYIAGFNVPGLVADEEMARRWYKRAAELGSREAMAYLSSTN